MTNSLLTTRVEMLSDDVLYVAFHGVAGVGSAAENEQGNVMRTAVRQAIEEHQPRCLIIDYSRFDYTFGDWIAPSYQIGLGKLGTGNVGLVAEGQTARGLASLLAYGNMTRFLRISSSVAEAAELFARPT